jgi:hypothetical protein
VGERGGRRDGDRGWGAGALPASLEVLTCSTARTPTGSRR